MRITNVDYTPVDVLSELLAAYKYSNHATKNFFLDERASHNWLVDQWAQKLDTVLDSFRRYGSAVYEQQHIRDYGVDIRMTFEHKDSTHKIGFQIKSNSEADHDARRPKGSESMVAILKRQAFEAVQRSGVKEWWVVLCFDGTTHTKRIQAINAELLSGGPLPVAIKLVDPRKAMCFLSMDEEEIDAICTLLLCRDDEVLKQAASEVKEMTHAMRQIALPTIGPALNGERTCTVRDLIELVPSEDCADGNVAIPVNALEANGFLSSDGGGETYTIEPSAYPGLCALYFEGRVRHRLSVRAASEYMQRLARRF